MCLTKWSFVYKVHFCDSLKDAMWSYNFPKAYLLSFRQLLLVIMTNYKSVTISTLIYNIPVYYKNRKFDNRILIAKLWTYHLLRWYALH